VLGAGESGHVFEWDLRGGRVCRALHKVPGCLGALVLDARRNSPPPTTPTSERSRAGEADGAVAGGAHHLTLWAGRSDGVLQLWKWPMPMTAPAGVGGDALTLVESTGAAEDDGDGRGPLRLMEKPPPFTTIVQQLAPLGGLRRPPSLASAASPMANGHAYAAAAGADAEPSSRVSSSPMRGTSLRQGGRPSRLQEFDCVITREEAEAAAAAAEVQADPLGATLSSMIDATESAMIVVGDALEEALTATSEAIEAIGDTINELTDERPATDLYALSPSPGARRGAPSPPPGAFRRR
jgi:hypothetical protein